TGLANAPTSWFWNVRLGDKVQLGGAGPWYTVVGPMIQGPNQNAGNPEMFANVGPPGSVSALNPTGSLPLDYLLLVDGRDDDADGWVDEGWDGIDQNGNGLVDEYQPGVFDTVNGRQVERVEWEAEAWQGAAAKGLANVPYVIRRRPLPLPGARELALPTAIVIDATTWARGTSAERSRLPVD